jgi:hydroxyacylglutathione hydrolase
MYIEQLYTSCLAEAAYYIESEGEAAVIDPLRDTTPYLKLAQERGAKIRFVLETHFHADFVSGHIDLAKQSGAKIVYGPGAETGYEVYQATDGEELKIGKLTLKVLHTPGHTPESVCFLLLDENQKPHAVFTGDTLFVGDVGRPDLLDGKMSKEELAGMMYDSLNTKIKMLPDDVIVYPGHGAGSSCGKNIGKETHCTIGTQKKTNYALQEMSKEEFIEKVTEGILPPPKYFFEDAKINKQGYQPIEQVIERNRQPLSPEDFEQAVAQGAQILDTRIPNDFEKGFIPGSLSIGLNGQYAIWVGSLLKIDQPLVLVCEEGKEEEAIIRLARVGYENVRGFLKGGMEAWKAAGKATDTVESVSAEEMKKLLLEETVLDVRKPGEYAASRVKGAEFLTLSELESKMEQLSKETPYLIHCAGGYRSMIAASMLKAKGYTKLKNVYGGFKSIRESGIELE